MRCLFYIALFISFRSFGQLTTTDLKTIDSLKQVIRTAKHDSIAIKSLIAWDMIIYVSDPKMDMELTEKIYALTVKNLKKKLTAKEKKFFLKAKGFSLNGLGLLYTDQGNHDKAISAYTSSLKVKELLNDKKGIADVLNNIGLLHLDRKDYPKSLDFFTQSKEIRTALGDSIAIAASLGNIGLVYEGLKKFPEAIAYQNQSLKIKERAGDQYGISSSLNNLGNVYFELGNYHKALDLYLRSLKINRDLGDSWAQSVCLNNIGNIYQKQGKYKQAIENSSNALGLAIKNNHALEIKNAAQSLYYSYKMSGNHKLSLEMHELYVTMRDSIESEENEKEIIRQEYKYQYEKQVIADSIKHAEAQKVKDAQLAQQKAQAEKQETELKNKRIQQYALFGGLGLLLIFTGFVYNRFRVTKKQKMVIEEKEKETQRQKEVIEEKQKEILDSIHYAKRIQNALMPNEKYINKAIDKQKSKTS